MADGKGGYIFGGVCIIIAAIIGIFKFDLNKSSVNIEEYENLSSKYQEVLTQNAELQSQKKELESEIKKSADENQNKDTASSESIRISHETSTEDENSESLPEKVSPSTSLLKLDYFSLEGSQYDFANLTDVKDNTGNTHYDALKIPYKTDVVYLLEGKYTNLSGNVFISFDDRDTRDKGKLKIYGDDNVLYSVDMSKEVRPASFSIDITGVDVLGIKYDTSYYDMLRIFLSNMILT